MDWWLQSRATRNLEGVVTGNTLLPTPRASAGENATTKRTPTQLQGKHKHGLYLASEACEIARGNPDPLLPTPRVQSGGGAGYGENDWTGVRPSGGKQALNLATAVTQLLPTPNAGGFNDGEDLASWEARRQKNLAKGINGNGQGTPLSIAVQQLLPTPCKSDGDGGKTSRSGARKGEKLIGGIVKDFLPTPNTLDSLPPKTREQIQAHRDEGKGGDRNLREAVLYELENFPGENPSRIEAGGEAALVSWGRYEPAIRRWEAILGRAAPDPTEPGITAPRLSPAFAEWVMGLPAGWVTDVDIKREAQLRAIGNGVVPQQAEMALRILLGET